MKATEIIGKDVVTLDGGKVGKILDLIIDDNWIVRGLLLRL
ncbi:MAG: photosystem reaction center subunit H, partial [Thermoprotei archaeon]